MTSLKVNEEEEAELARVGVSLGLPSGTRHSLPAREPWSTGADETCPPVCIMKSSSWRTISLPSSHCSHRILPFFPPRHPPLLRSNLLETGRKSWRYTETRVRAGRSLISCQRRGPRAYFLRQLSHPWRAQPDPRTSGIYSKTYKVRIIRDLKCSYPAMQPYPTERGAEAPKLKHTCPLSNGTSFFQTEQEIAAKHRENCPLFF